MGCAISPSGFPQIFSVKNRFFLYAAPADWGTRTATGGFALSGRQLFSAPADWGTRTASACSPYPGGSFSAPAERGTRTAAGVFAPNGRRVFRLKSSEELRSAERGDSPRPAAGQEGRHQGFYPLNSHFLWGGSGADCRPVTAAK